jgi:hypothetical protein
MLLKRLMIKLGVHGKQHEVAKIQRELRNYTKSTMAQYMFWQGEMGHALNQSGRLLP